ncbi:MAG: outer membrane protein assembly factor BamA [Betaproteobacteria bacterium RIFCSPLOWO2_12_FULL_62_58]|nr:MAG: outer membrane protein assembly factor BamA [Betaproteobacteria bacterium RIFCSPLOWO2_12_FULL_62_58]
MSLARVILSLLMLCALPAAALEPFAIKDIRIEGIQRTEAGTVFSYLPVKVGDTMTEEKAAQAIRALFATGFFKDVSLEVDNGVLVVVVQERPSVAQIDFAGMREFDKEQLIKGMRQVGLAEGRIFDKGLLDRAEQELKRQYLSRGMYAVNISTTVTPLERNRVAINFSIEEGEVSKIRQISIIGANALRERDLLGLFVLRTPGLMTWFSKHDQYSRQKLAADLETLRSHYLDRGYLEFNVDSTQVSITPDKKEIYISISITEGSKYTVSDIKVAGEKLIPEDEALKLIRIKPGETFSRARLTESTKLITDRLGNDGYAFANVNAIPAIDKQKQRVAFTFFIDPGRRVYVHRINISGNTRTRDEVIRREMRQLEGGWYSGDKINLSRSRIDKLGYFTEVNVETPAVPGTTDQVDLNISVVEKPTGVILLGAGFGSGEGLLLSGAVTQQNIFGSGKHVTAQINSGKINTTYALSYTDPYFTVDGVSQGFDVYLRKIDAVNSGLGFYQTRTAGAALRLGVPISEIDTINYGLGYEDTSITTYPESPLLYQDYVATFGDHNSTVLGTIGWARDGRDSLIYPTAGTLQKATGEVGLPGGTLKYYKASYQYQRYFPLTRSYTLMLNGELGYGVGYGGKPLPFFRNFYAGGVNSVRGFRSFTIGPKDSNGDPRGGSRRVVANAELLFPFPGLDNDRSVRMSAFADAGMVGDAYSTGDFRYSTGLAVLWVSPLGPLKISVALPFGDKPGDRKQPLQFTIGGVF